MNSGNQFVSALVLGGLCACLTAGSIRCYSQQTGPREVAPETEETFQARCSTCHAEHGEGSEVGASLNVPDLRSPFVQKNADAQLRQIIRNGKGNMPSFGRDFSDSQIDRILALIRSFAAPSDHQAQAATSQR